MVTIRDEFFNIDLSFFSSFASAQAAFFPGQHHFLVLPQAL